MQTQLQSILAQERDADYKLKGKENYLHHEVVSLDTSPDSEQIDDSWRLKIAEWAFEVVDYFSYDRDVVAISLNYIDRYMLFNTEDNEKDLVCRKEFQLITLTSLYIAMKLHGDSSDPHRAGRKPSLRLFVGLARNIFTCSEIEKMEFKILNKLRWRLNPPLAATIIKLLFNLFPNWITHNPRDCQKMKISLYETARYLTEMATCVSDFSFKFQPSILAYAAVLLSLDALEQNLSLHETFPPYHVILKFIHNIHEEIFLEPSTEGVDEAKSMLSDICPHIFPAADNSFMDSSSVSSSTDRIKQAEEQRRACEREKKEEIRDSPTEIFNSPCEH